MVRLTELIDELYEPPTAQQTAPATPWATVNGDSVFDKLSEAASWADILSPLGWIQVKPGDSATLEAWQHPTASHPISAHVLKKAPYAIVNWSENSGLPVGADQDLTKAKAYAILNYRGDKSAAAKALVKGVAVNLPAHVVDAVRTSGPPPASNVSEVTANQITGDNAAEPQGRRLKVTRASDITMKATRWLWEQYGTKWIPLGALALLGGREGVGKSTTSYDCVAKITRGLLPGHLNGTPKSVIVCATEDARTETIVPKLVGAAADLERVLRVDSVSPEGFEGALSLPADVQRLRQLIGEEDVAFVLLDPLLSTLDIKLDSHKDAEVRMALEPLSRLAQDTQVSMLGLIHENKSNAADLLTRIMGSRAFTAVVRAVLYCARHEDELDDLFDRYVFGQLKSNLGPRAKSGVKYHIESAHVGHDDDLNLPIWNSIVVWDGLTDESIQDIVTAQEKRKAKSPNVESAQSKAEKWLEAYLSEHGLTPSKKVKAMAGRDGHSEASIKRAADAMDIHIGKIPGTRNETTWELPQPFTPTTPLVELTELTDLTELTEPTEPTDKGVGS
jgi:AAA domain